MNDKVKPEPTVKIEAVKKEKEKVTKPAEDKTVTLNSEPVIKLPGYEIVEISKEELLQQVELFILTTGNRCYDHVKPIPIGEIIKEKINLFVIGGEARQVGFQGTYSLFNKKENTSVPLKFFKASCNNKILNKTNEIYFDSSSSINLKSENMPLISLEDEIEDKNKNILFVFGSNVVVTGYSGMSMIMNVDISYALAISDSLVFPTWSSVPQAGEPFPGIGSISVPNVRLNKSVIIDSTVASKELWEQFNVSEVYINDSSLRGRTCLEKGRLVRSKIESENTDLQNFDIYDSEIVIGKNHNDGLSIERNTSSKYNLLRIKNIKINNRCLSIINERNNDTDYDSFDRVTINHPMHCANLENLFLTKKSVVIYCSNFVDLYVSDGDGYQTNKTFFFVPRNATRLQIMGWVSKFFGKENENLLDTDDQMLDKDIKTLTDIIVSRLNVVRLINRLNVGR